MSWPQGAKDSRKILIDKTLYMAVMLQVSNPHRLVFQVLWKEETQFHSKH